MLQPYFAFTESDWRMGVRLAAQLRLHYCPPIAIADGPVPLEAVQQIAGAGARVLEKSGTQKDGGIYTEIIWRLVLAISPAPRFLKIDPDTYIWRAAEPPPGEWCGHIFQANKFAPMVHGSASAFSRSLMERVLIDPRRLRATGAQYRRRGVWAEDIGLGLLLYDMDVRPTPWPAVFGETRPIPNPDRRWAITHKVLPNLRYVVTP